ncbi:hypothetical protein YPPY06_1631, partial [Yersinia pestis PY-06]|jgi:hypothetical protein
MSGG